MIFRYASVVVPSDTVDLPGVSTGGLFIGGSSGSSTITVTMASGQIVTFTGMPVGVLPIAVSRVWTTGTTATNIVALR